MFPTLCARPSLALFSLAALLSLAGGCGGASAPRSTLPQEELSQLTLLPRDAFLAGRLDVNELRRTPHWTTLMERVRDDEPAMVELLEGTRHVYFAIGGLVPMPRPPAFFDADGNYVTQPAWAEWSRQFGGAAPAAVVIIEGAGARICRMVMEERQSRSHGGFEITDMDGVAIMLRDDDFCAVTFTPMVEALMGQPAGEIEIAQRLGGESPSTVARLVLQLDSPTVSALLERVGQPAAEGPDDAPPGGMSEEEVASYRAEMATIREADQRRADFVRSAIRIVAHGLTSVVWQVAGDAEGYETRTHVAGLDESRLAMWQELTEMFFDILTEAVRTNVFSTSDDTLADFVRTVRFDEVDDGYVITRHTRQQTISRLLSDMLPGPTQDAFEVATAPVLESDAYQIEQMNRSTSEGPAAIIAAIQPNLAFIRTTASPYEQRALYTALANAYGQLGRFEEGVAVLEQAIATAGTYTPANAANRWWVEASNASVCVYSASACELHLARGNAEGALAATRVTAPGAQRTCTQADFSALSCAAAATAALGRVDEAFTQLESEGGGAGVSDYVGARVRTLVWGGRAAEAYSLARAVCAGGPASNGCDPLRVALVDALAASATRFADAEPTLAVVSSRFAADVTPRDQAVVQLAAADCALRARLDGAAEGTRAACAAALADAIAFHGENHPRVAAVRMSYAQALDRARQRTEATEQRTAAQPVIDTLGPQHPLRAR